MLRAEAFDQRDLSWRDVAGRVVKRAADKADVLVRLTRLVDRVEGPNYLSTMATMRVTRDGAEVAMLYPEKRVYPVAQMPTTEAAIDYGLFRDLYLVIGDPQDGGGYAVRSYIKPFANWIWAGSILMALGGLYAGMVRIQAAD